MNIVHIIIGCSLVLNNCYGMQFAYRKARLQDSSEMLRLMEQAGQNEEDRKRIVILPDPFRKGAVEGTINDGILHVIELKQEKQLVGYSKMHIIQPEHYTEKLNQELQLIGKNRDCAFTGIVTDEDIQPEALPEFNSADTLFIYKGGDYTIPELRGKGLNQQLTAVTLQALQEKIQELLKNRTYKHIALVFGLTLANSGNGTPGQKGDRTNSIAVSFKKFLISLVNQKITKLDNYRFKACMPTFKVIEEDGKPKLTVVPSDKRPDFGNILRYSFKH